MVKVNNSGFDKMLFRLISGSNPKLFTNFAKSFGTASDILNNEFSLDYAEAKVSGDLENALHDFANAFFEINIQSTIKYGRPIFSGKINSIKDEIELLENMEAMVAYATKNIA